MQSRLSRRTMSALPGPIQGLRAEHVAVRTALRILDSIARRTAGGHPFPASDLATVLRFLRDFGEGVHAQKEAAHLLPALLTYGDEAMAELTGRLLGLQEEASTLLRGLVLFWEPADGFLTPDERRTFAATAAAFRTLLLRAMEVEEAQLFPAAERAVPADDRLSWIGAFARHDEERSALADWQSELASLAARWV
jgi:hemerythrin-like domain-containing protein